MENGGECNWLGFGEDESPTTSMSEKSSVSTAFRGQTEDFWCAWLTSPEHIGLIAESGADQFEFNFTFCLAIGLL